MFISAHYEMGLYNYDSVFRLLAEMDEGEWCDVIPHALKLGAHLDTRVTTKLVAPLDTTIKEIRKIPNENRSLAVSRYSEFLDQLSQMTIDTIYLGGGMTSDKIYLGSGKLFAKLSALSEAEWNKILPRIIPLMAASRYEGSMIRAIETFIDVPDDRMIEICASFEEFKENMSKANVFLITAGLTPDDIKDMPRIFDSLTKLRGNGNFLDAMLNDIATIKPSKRVAFLRTAIPYLQNIDCEKKRSCFLEGLMAFELEEMPRLVEICAPILKRLEKNHSHFTIFIKDFDSDHLPSVIRLIEMLCPTIYDGMHLSGLVNTLTKIPGPDLTELVSLLDDLFQSISIQDTNTGILFTFYNIASDQRPKVLESCLPLFRQFHFGHEALARELAVIPEEERAAYLEETTRLLQNEQDGYLYADTLKLIYSLDLYGEGARSRILEKYQVFLNSFESREMRIISTDFRQPKTIPSDNIGCHKLRNYFMSILNALPTEVLGRSIDALNHLRTSDTIRFNRIHVDPNEIIAYLREANVIEVPALVDEWRGHLRNNPNKGKVKLLADFITQNYQWFSLFEQDDIVQEAIRTGINLENSNDPLNPYKIFENLRIKREEPVNFDAITPATDVFGGLRVRYIPSFLKDEVFQYRLTAGDLPRHSKSFLETSSRHFEERLATDPALDSKVTEITTQNYTALKASALLDGTLNRIASSAGDSMYVSVIAARFVAIVSYLESLSTTRQEGALFSPQEEGFLRMLASIQGCPNGKSEGINAYYLNILPANLRYAATHAYGEEDVAYLRSKSEVVQILAEEVEKMFSGQNSFMKSLVGIRNSDQVMQASHQAGYLRNLIGDVVGLGDQLSFDAHTQTLYRSLINMPKQEAVENFYTFFEPHSFIGRIAEKYKLDEQGAIELLSQMGILSISEETRAAELTTLPSQLTSAIPGGHN